MELDDLDIYNDLDAFHANEQNKNAELQALEDKHATSLKEIEKLILEKKSLTKKIKTIEVNFQNLLDTAKAEIKRKDQLIAQLRKEKDDLCFRRRHVKQNSTHTYEQQQQFSYVPQQEKPTSISQHAEGFPSTTACGRNNKAPSNLSPVKKHKNVELETEAEHKTNRVSELKHNEQIKQSTGPNLSQNPKLHTRVGESGKKEGYRVREHSSAKESRASHEISCHHNEGKESAHYRETERQHHVRDRKEFKSRIHERHHSNKEGELNYAREKKRRISNEREKKIHGSSGGEHQRSRETKNHQHVRERSQSREQKQAPTRKSSSDSEHSSSRHIKHGKRTKDEQQKAATETTSNNCTAWDKTVNNANQELTSANTVNKPGKLIRAETDSTKLAQHCQRFNVDSVPETSSTELAQACESFEAHTDENTYLAVAASHDLNTPKKVAMYNSLFGSPLSSAATANCKLLTNVRKILQYGSNDSTTKTTPSHKHSTDVSEKNEVKVQSSKHTAGTTECLTNINEISDYLTKNDVIDKTNDMPTALASSINGIGGVHSGVLSTFKDAAVCAIPGLGDLAAVNGVARSKKALQKHEPDSLVEAKLVKEVIDSNTDTDNAGTVLKSGETENEESKAAHITLNPRDDEEIVMLESNQTTMMVSKERIHIIEDIRLPTLYELKNKTLTDSTIQQEMATAVDKDTETIQILKNKPHSENPDPEVNTDKVENGQKFKVSTVTARVFDDEVKVGRSLEAASVNTSDTTKSATEAAMSLADQEDIRLPTLYELKNKTLTDSTIQQEMATALDKDTETIQILKNKPYSENPDAEVNADKVENGQKLKVSAVTARNFDDEVKVGRSLEAASVNTSDTTKSATEAAMSLADQVEPKQILEAAGERAQVFNDELEKALRVEAAVGDVGDTTQSDMPFVSVSASDVGVAKDAEIARTVNDDVKIENNTTKIRVYKESKGNIVKCNAQMPTKIKATDNTDGSQILNTTTTTATVVSEVFKTKVVHNSESHHILATTKSTVGLEPCKTRELDKSDSENECQKFHSQSNLESSSNSHTTILSKKSADLPVMISEMRNLLKYLSEKERKTTVTDNGSNAVDTQVVMPVGEECSKRDHNSQVVATNAEAKSAPSLVTEIVPTETLSTSSELAVMDTSVETAMRQLHEMDSASEEPPPTCKSETGAEGNNQAQHIEEVQIDKTVIVAKQNNKAVTAVKRCMAGSNGLGTEGAKPLTEAIRGDQREYASNHNKPLRQNKQKKEAQTPATKQVCAVIASKHPQADVCSVQATNATNIIVETNTLELSKKQASSQGRRLKGTRKRCVQQELVTTAKRPLSPTTTEVSISERKRSKLHGMEVLSSCATASAANKPSTHRVFRREVKILPKMTLNSDSTTTGWPAAELPPMAAKRAISEADTKFNEIDSRLQSIFQLPVQEATIALCDPAAKCAATPHNSSFDESLNSSVTSGAQHPTADSSQLDTSCESKRVSMGSSDYRFEKISENVVKLYITRKRSKQRKSNKHATT